MRDELLQVMWFDQALIRTAAAKGAREKGSLEMHGVAIYIEYPKGSIRSKVGPDGKKWSRKMGADYGRLSKTEGADGDCIDVFLGTDDSENAFIVNQVSKEGDFDEHKCVLGCESKADAKKLYLSNYPKDWTCGEIVEMTIPEFKKWLKKGDKNVAA